LVEREAGGGLKGQAATLREDGDRRYGQDREGEAESE